ncbi:MAG: hypothetical protein OEQ53_00105 [Saprospiraceae bacterium]|nr:hypothetical protein [Saprospiraceae bacterium]
MNRNILDRLFKANLDHSDQPVNPVHWSQAQEMIKANTKKKKRDRWLFFLFLGILGTIHVGIVYWNSLDIKSKIQTEIKGEQLMAEKSTKELPREGPENEPRRNDSIADVENGITRNDLSGRTANSNHIYSDDDQKAKESSASSDLNKSNALSTLPRTAPQLKIESIQPPVTNSIEYRHDSFVSQDQIHRDLAQGQPETEDLSPVAHRTPLEDSASAQSSAVANLNTLSLLRSSIPELRWIYDLDQNIKPHAGGSVLATAKYRETRLGWTGILLLNPAIRGSSPLQGFVLGFTGEYHLSRDWYVGTKPSIQMRLNQDGFSKFQQLTSFSFEAVSTTYGLKTNSLQMVSLPVYFGYRKGKHLLDLGGSVDLLLAARGRLQQIDVEGREITALESLNSGWIETDDMQSLSINLFAGYRFAVTDRFYTGMSFFFIPGRIYPGLPNNLNQNLKSRWHLGLQATYYIR